jgi:hypothetical protein
MCFLEHALQMLQKGQLFLSQMNMQVREEDMCEVMQSIYCECG